MLIYCDVDTQSANLVIPFVKLENDTTVYYCSLVKKIKKFKVKKNLF